MLTRNRVQELKVLLTHNKLTRRCLCVSLKMLHLDRQGPTGIEVGE